MQKHLSFILKKGCVCDILSSVNLSFGGTIEGSVVRRAIIARREKNSVIICLGFVKAKYSIPKSYLQKECRIKCKRSTR